MVSSFPLHRYSFAEYLSLEAESSTRHEFLEGEIVAMAGGTPEHAALAMAVGRQLGNQLAGSPYRVFSSDLRVRIEETGLTRAKLEHYQTIPSLSAIVIVSHRETLVETWERTADGWVHTAARQGQRLLLKQLGAELDVDSLYADAGEPDAPH